MLTKNVFWCSELASCLHGFNGFETVTSINGIKHRSALLDCFSSLKVVSYSGTANMLFSQSLLIGICLAGQSNALNLVLSNDDGWAEINIRTFYNALTAARNSVVLSAPAENESGTGKSLAVNSASFHTYSLQQALQTLQLPL